MTVKNTLRFQSPFVNEGLSQRAMPASDLFGVKGEKSSHIGKNSVLVMGGMMVFVCSVLLQILIM